MFSRHNKRVWDTITWQRRRALIRCAINTAGMQKTAFDTVEKSTAISASQIAAIVRDFAKAENKLRLETAAYARGLFGRSSLGGRARGDSEPDPSGGSLQSWAA